MEKITDSPTTPRRQTFLRWAGLVLTLLVAAYGTWSVFYTIRDVGDTIDEAGYRYAGWRYIEVHDFSENHEHPPLSKLIGAIYPRLVNDHSIEAYRYGHAVLYVLGGLGVAAVLFRLGFGIAAVIFGFLYFLCPNLKAMASLDVTDSDCAIFFAVSALALFTLLEIRRSLRLVGASYFLGGLAALCKATGLVALLPLTLALKAGKRLRPELLACLAALHGLVTAFLVAYLFLPGELHWYLDGIQFQRNHNAAGHDFFLFGTYDTHGVWYFYLVLFLFKLPLAALALLGLGAAYFSFRIDSPLRRSIAAAFLAPSAVLLIALSVARVQLGFRYFLPGLLLLYLACALSIDRGLKNTGDPRRRRRLAALVCGLLSLLLVTDAQILRAGSYLSFFNVLAPNPTRNFFDSSIDWRQGIPRHLQGPLPPLVEAGRILESRLECEEAEENTYVVAGPLILNGDFSFGRELRTYEPWRVVAGYEIFQVDQDEKRFLCELADQDDVPQPPPPKPEPWKPSPPILKAMLLSNPSTRLTVEKDPSLWASIGKCTEPLVRPRTPPPKPPAPPPANESARVLDGINGCELRNYLRRIRKSSCP